MGRYGQELSMTRTSKALILASLLLAVVMAAVSAGAGAQVVTPRPEELRYYTLLSEPVAAPGRRGVVAGTSAMLVKDRITGQCFVAITVGEGVGLSPSACE
jgi:hypothetical protein